jgi:hypothetical protein
MKAVLGLALPKKLETISRSAHDADLLRHLKKDLEQARKLSTRK